MKTLAPWLIVAGLLSVNPALAQKRDDAADDLSTSESAASNVVRPEDAADAPPEEDAELQRFVADKEAQLAKVRQNQIQQMRKILDRDPLYKKKADLLFRIAEKEWEEGKYQYFLQRKDYDKRYQAFLDGNLKQRPEEPVADYSKALVEYKTLLKEFPNYERIDEVMFYLGQGLITAGNKREGTSYMSRLTKDYPQSKYLTRAYLAVAEFYFDNDLLQAAKVNYEKVIADKQSGEYPYALYKLGYVLFNLKDYEQAIQAFHEVVNLSKGQDRRKVYFTEQAYGALTQVYAEVDDGWKRGRDYFREMGGDELANKQLETIARVYNKQDKTDLEVAVYEYLISANQQGPRIPAYAESITEAYKKQENLEKTDEVINRFIGFFDPKSSWHVANKDNEEAMTRSGDYRESQLDYLIGTYHSKAQEFEEKLKDPTRASAAYKKAATYYEQYIVMFPESKDIYDKEFYLAEILAYQQADWDKAIKHYSSVVQRDPKGKYSKESAYKVILCAEEKMGAAKIIDAPNHFASANTKTTIEEAKVEYGSRRKDDDFAPIPETPLHETEQGFLEACKAFTDTYPKDDEVPAVSFRSAEIFIKKGHYAEGVQRLEVIMEHHPKHRFAGFAAATLFDANYRLRRWDQMERWARYMLERKNYQVLKRGQLQDVIAVSINEYATELKKKGSDLAKEGQTAEANALKKKAAGEWVRFVDEFGREKSQHDKAAVALFNAAATTEELEETASAIDMYESLIKRFPKSSQATEAHFVLGALYESQTDFEQAANYFEKMASFPDVPQMADALYNAGAIRGALEQYPQAIEIFETYVKKFPTREDTQEVFIKIAEFHERMGQNEKAHKVYDRYAKAYGKSHPADLVDIHLRKAKLFIASGGKTAERNASRELTMAGKAFQQLPDTAKGADALGAKTRRAAAEARFLEGEFIYEEFSAVELKFPIGTLRRALVKKAELQQKAEKIYLEVLDFQAHDVNAGALFRLGESYYLFSKSLFDLPMPPGLSEDEEIIYRAELDDTAAPLQEKGIEAAQRALSLAHRNGVYNEWSARSAALLVKLSPESFPVLEDMVNNSDHVVPATFSAAFIKDPEMTLETVQVAPPPAPTPAAAPAQGEAAQSPAETKEAP